MEGKQLFLLGYTTLPLNNTATKNPLIQLWLGLTTWVPAMAFRLLLSKRAHSIMFLSMQLDLEARVITLLHLSRPPRS